MLEYASDKMEKMISLYMIIKINSYNILNSIFVKVKIEFDINYEKVLYGYRNYESKKYGL